MVRSTAITLQELVCLGCGIKLAPAKVHEGEGFYVPAEEDWRSPRFLGVRGQTCRECATAFDEYDPHRALYVFETRIEALLEKHNPEAHKICLDVKSRSHPDIDKQKPNVRVRLDRSELTIRGQHEFHTWRQASFAWKVMAHGDDAGWRKRFGWIDEGYVFPEVTRPTEQRYIDGNQLPRYPDGTPVEGPEDPKKRREWLRTHGAIRWRTLEPARLVDKE